MGAKFAPSLTNLFMSKWEVTFIYAQRRSELMFYKRYIDDLILVWVGSEQSLIEFMNCLNANENHIKLDYH